MKASAFIISGMTHTLVAETVRDGRLGAAEARAIKHQTPGACLDTIDSCRCTQAGGRGRGRGSEEGARARASGAAADAASKPQASQGLILRFEATNQASETASSAGSCLHRAIWACRALEAVRGSVSKIGGRGLFLSCRMIASLGYVR